MDKTRRKAREYLEQTTKEDFFFVIDESKLTPRQKQIISLKYLNAWSYVQISLHLLIDVNVIKKDMQKAYDKVGHLLHL